MLLVVLHRSSELKLHQVLMLVQLRQLQEQGFHIPTHVIRQEAISLDRRRLRVMEPLQVALALLVIIHLLVLPSSMVVSVQIPITSTIKAVLVAAEAQLLLGLPVVVVVGPVVRLLITVTLVLTMQVVARHSLLKMQPMVGSFSRLSTVLVKYLSHWCKISLDYHHQLSHQ